CEKVGSAGLHFTCATDKDGEYWFALTIVAKDGEITVSDAIRVVVDTAQAKDPLPLLPSLPAPPLFPAVETKSPKPPEFRELPAQEVNALIEKAFGVDSPEMKRPVRLWIPNLGMAIAAKEAKVSDL